MEPVTKHFRKRDAILSWLQSTDTHPSAEMVFAQLKPQIPDLSLGTVYRNLTLFKKQGLVSSVATVNGVERFDGNTDPHVHFICDNCDAVIDLMDLQVPESLKSIAAVSCGGRVDGCQLSFTGICQGCKAQNETA